MGTAVLVSDVIEEARVRLDHDAPTAGTFITSTEALSFVKFSARRLSAILRAANSDYFLTRGTLTTTPNVDSVSLPSNCTDVRQIAWLRSSTESIPLEVAGVDDYLASGEQVEAWGAAPKYRLHGGSVRFFPTPNAAYTLSLYYDTGIFITATSDSIDAQPGWEEWLVQDYCAKARQKEEKDPSIHLVELKRVEQEIVAAARQRDRFRTLQVRDEWLGGEAVDTRSLYWRR